MTEVSTKELFNKWQSVACQMAEFYRLSEAEQKKRVCADWIDDLVEGWSSTLTALQDEICARPVTNWDDVAILGVLALQHQAGSDFDGSVEDLASSYAMDRATGYLIRAVGIMAKRGGISPLIADADFDKGLPRDEKADKAA